MGLNFATMRAVLAGEAGEGLTHRVQARVLRRMGDSMQIESLWRFNAKLTLTGNLATRVYDAPENLLAVAIAVARAESFWELPVIGRFLVPSSPVARGASGWAGSNGGEAGERNAERPGPTLSGRNSAHLKGATLQKAFHPRPGPPPDPAPRSSRSARLPSRMPIDPFLPDNQMGSKRPTSRSTAGASIAAVRWATRQWFASRRFMRWRSATNFVLDRPRTPQPSTSAATRHQGQAMSRRRSWPSRTSSYCVSKGAKGARIRIIRSSSMLSARGSSARSTRS